MEYHEVYGWMPQDIIDKLDTFDRSMLFLSFITRKPTEAGWRIVSATVKELGESFLEYVFKNTINSLQEDGEVTKDEVIEIVRDLFTSFATDLNIFRQYVEEYLNEYADECVESKKQMPERDAKGRFVKKK
jgi:hypothetical protein